MTIGYVKDNAYDINYSHKATPDSVLNKEHKLFECSKTISYVLFC